MYIKVKKRFKPKLKKFKNSKIILFNNKKILSLKKKKWNKYLNYFLRLSKYKKRNCYYKFYDQCSYNVSRFLNRFVNKYKFNLGLKRRFKILYGNLKQRYVKRLIDNSLKKNVYVKKFFISSLEKRLDVVLLKACFAFNIRTARQLISHNNIKVNNKIIKTNSFILKCGDKITVSKKTHSLLEYRLANNNIWPLPPKYLQINYKIFQIIITSNPLNINLANNFDTKIDFETIIKSYKV